MDQQLMQEEEAKRRLAFGKGSREANQGRKFADNYISTTKYNMFTFLPLAVLFQFKRFANIYFLVIAILQSIPIISPLNPITAILPLAFVIGISVIREGIENYACYQSDKVSNSSPAQVYRDGAFVALTWKDVAVGDLVRVHKDELIPADLVLVVSSNEEGPAFVETSSLDGEKTLKHKAALKELQLLHNELKDELFCEFTGQIECTAPNENLGDFEGFVRQSEDKWSLTAKQLLLRGARFMNTGWGVGICVYSGVDTKLMKNSSGGRVKISGVESRVNYFIIGIILFQVLCCLGASLFALFECQDNGYQWRLEGFDYSCGGIAAITFFSYFLLNNTMIPISLIVSLEIVKIAQGIFMARDKEVFSQARQKNLRCLTVSLNEELGQVQYICTDKTGTLTANLMEFRFLVAGNYTFGDRVFLQEEPALRPMSMAPENNHESSMNDQLQGRLSQKKRLPEPLVLSRESQLHFESEVLSEMLMVMSCCHECVSEEAEGRVKFQGPSPDEIALVEAAWKMGYRFVSVKNGVINLLVGGRQTHVQLLHLFEFNSDRKRMSVVVRAGGRVRVYCKGADSIISARLGPRQPFLDSIQGQIDEFSRKGLRTLLFAVKDLPEEDYQRAKSAILSAMGTQAEKEVLEQQVAGFESDLVLVGATALEDKLQDKVPQTLRDFLQAKIKVLMLTGDKLETAESIARSCNLLPPGVPYFKYQGESLPVDDESQFVFFLEGERMAALDERQRLYLKYLVLKCKAAVFCRVSPKQKAEVVRMVKQLGQKVLAVGDGSNDVNMIVEADVGVGVYGEEGTRAVNTANYAVGEFKILWKLLLYHGRLNYIRISDMILYFFYKNMVFTVPQTVFCFYCNGSGQSIFNNWGITLYNMLFTVLPVMIRAVFEVDLFVEQGETHRTDQQTPSVLYQYYPRLYYLGQLNLLFTTPRFLKWLCLGLAQGVLCFLVVFYSLGGPSVTGAGGFQTKYEFVSITLYTAIIFQVTLKLAINTQFWNLLTWFAYLVTSIGSYLLFMVMSNLVPLSGIYMQTGSLVTMPAFYLSLFFAILLMFAVDLMAFSSESLEDTFSNYLKFEANPSAAKAESLSRKVDSIYLSRKNPLIGQLQQEFLLDKKVQALEIQF